MITPAKRIILQGLNKAGYRHLKREEYECLLVTAAEAQQAAQAPQSGILPSPPFVPASPSASSLEVAEFAPVMGGTNLASFLDRVKGIRDLSHLRAVALYSIVDYIVRANVKGEVIDCGYGRTATLVAMAAAFVQIGDTSRRLVLFDTSADPERSNLSCREPIGTPKMRGLTARSATNPDQARQHTRLALTVLEKGQQLNPRRVSSSSAGISSQQWSEESGKLPLGAPWDYQICL